MKRKQEYTPVVSTFGPPLFSEETVKKIFGKTPEEFDRGVKRFKRAANRKRKRLK